MARAAKLRAAALAAADKRLDLGVRVAVITCETATGRARRRADFDTCSFINVLLELGPDHPAGRASIHHLSNIRSIVRQLADEAGLRDTDALARSWHILMKGSIVSAAEGDLDAARHAKAMAGDLLEHHR